MSFEGAQQFVMKMREDASFREQAKAAAEKRAIPPLCRHHDLDFDLHDLVRAMAACMDEMAAASETV